MHNFLAGFMGFFMGMSAMFHGGHTGLPNSNKPQTTASINASPSAGFRGMRNGKGRMNLPNGEKPFFGTVTSVSGSTITVQMQRWMMRPQKEMISPSITPKTMQTVTIDVDSTTTYKGGALSDIVVGTKIAGIGKTNSDNSITALQVQINPTMPSGFPQKPSPTQ